MVMSARCVSVWGAVDARNASPACGSTLFEGIVALSGKRRPEFAGAVGSSVHTRQVVSVLMLASVAPSSGVFHLTCSSSVRAYMDY